MRAARPRRSEDAGYRGSWECLVLLLLVAGGGRVGRSRRSISRQYVDNSWACGLRRGEIPASARRRRFLAWLPSDLRPVQEQQREYSSRLVCLATDGARARASGAAPRTSLSLRLPRSLSRTFSLAPPPPTPHDERTAMWVRGCSACAFCTVGPIGRLRARGCY